jgi:hypothetical protein
MVILILFVIIIGWFGYLSMIGRFELLGFICALDGRVIQRVFKASHELVRSEIVGFFLV